MKKMGKILAIGVISILLFSGILVGYGSAFEGRKVSVWQTLLKIQVNDDFPESEPLPAYEGNTPGFWKKHLDDWVGYSSDQLVSEVFVIPDGPFWDVLIGSKTLLEALKFHGGPFVFGKARILLRHAVAGLLNGAHPEIHYIYTYNDLQWLVNYPLKKSNTELMLHNKDLIETQNELGSNLG
jgi:hypothetical protein